MPRDGYLVVIVTVVLAVVRVEEKVVVREAAEGVTVVLVEELILVRPAPVGSKSLVQATKPRLVVSRLPTSRAVPRVPRISVRPLVPLASCRLHI